MKWTVREIVEKDCRARGLNREDAMDHSRWRKQIGMIDDHDECEWLNVSSGTGKHRTSPETGDPALTCPHCGRQFTAQIGLFAHLKWRH